MALQVTVNAVDVTDRVIWEDSYFEEAADEGRVGGGLLVIRDQPGTFIPAFGQAVLLRENGTVRWRGIVSPDETGRDDTTDWVGPRREVRISLHDSNHLFDRASVDGTVRASETDRARVIAAMAAERPSVNTSTYVPSTGNVTMEARTYADMMLRDEIADCAEEAGKDYWIDRDLNLHYVIPTSADDWVAPITLTDNPATYRHNILASVASNFNVGLIRQRTDPYAIPLQNRLTLKYGPGSPPASVTVNNTTSQATYGVIEGPPVYDDRATTSASATNRATALLAKMATPEIGYDTTVALPDLTLQAGQYIAVTSSPLNLTAQPLKVATMTARRKSNKDGHYWEVTLALNAPRRFVPRPRGFVQTSGHQSLGTPAGTEWQNSATASLTGQLTHTWNKSSAFTAFSETHNYAEVDLSAIIPAGATWRWRVASSNRGGLLMSVSDPGSGLPSTVGIYQGTWTTQPATSATNISGAYIGSYAWTHTIGRNLVLVSSSWALGGSDRKIKAFVHSATVFGWHNDPGDPFADRSVCNRGEDLCTYDTDLNLTVPTLFDYQWNPVITSGQWMFGRVVQEPADGSRTRFTTGSPYVSGSLRVYVDGLWQQATEVNPAAGTFLLSFAPFSGELVTADYIVGVGA